MAGTSLNIYFCFSPWFLHTYYFECGFTFKPPLLKINLAVKQSMGCDRISNSETL